MKDGSFDVIFHFGGPLTSLSVPTTRLASIDAKKLWREVPYIPREIAAASLLVGANKTSRLEPEFFQEGERVFSAGLPSSF